MPIPYVEIVFTGGADEVKTFLARFVDDPGDDAGLIYFSEQVGITGEGRVHHLLAAVRLTVEHTHVLVPERALPRIKKTLADAGKGVALHAAHQVVETRFHFQFQSFNREHADKIEEIFRSLPEEVKVEGYAPRTRIDESAKGPELYTPTHDFEFEGRGVAVGPVEGLVLLHEAAKEEPLIIMEKIRIVLGADLGADGETSA